MNELLEFTIVGWNYKDPNMPLQQTTIQFSGPRLISMSLFEMMFGEYTDIVVRSDEGTKRIKG
jgi:hypothetical protein